MADEHGKEVEHKTSFLHLPSGEGEIRTLFVMLGVPGSGKTTWARGRNLAVFSKPFEGESPPYKQIYDAIQRQDVAIDGCGLWEPERVGWLRYGREIGVWCALVVIDCSWETVNKRNMERPKGKRVSAHVMARYRDRFLEAIPLIRGEGWDEISEYGSESSSKCG